MEQMQFAAVILLTLLLAKLLLMPNKVVMSTVMGRARWLMTIGIALLDVQFLLQYALGLRALGVTQAVLVNLLLFIPSSWTISLAIINLQRQGQLSRTDKLVGGVTWALALLILGTAAAIDGLTRVALCRNNGLRLLPHHAGTLRLAAYEQPAGHATGPAKLLRP